MSPSTEVKVTAATYAANLARLWSLAHEIEQLPVDDMRAHALHEDYREMLAAFQHVQTVLERMRQRRAKP